MNLSHPKAKVETNFTAFSRALLGCIIVTTILFGLTVFERRPWFGELASKVGTTGHHQNNTASTIIFTRNWFIEGGGVLKWGKYLNPASVEFPNLASRNLYSSYPIMGLLPIYLIAKLSNSEPSIAIVMSWNLFNHWLMAIFTGVTGLMLTWQLLRHFAFRSALSCSWGILCASCVLLLPAPMYWMQNVFHNDQSAFAPFALILLLETIQQVFPESRHNQKLKIFEQLLFFCAVLTEWLIFFVLIVLFCLRLEELWARTGSKKEMLKSVLHFWTVPSLALGAYFFHLLLTIDDLFKFLIEKFLYRSGLGASGQILIEKYFMRFWQGHIADGFGQGAILMLWSGLGIALFYKFRWWQIQQYLNTANLPTFPTWFEEIRQRLISQRSLLIPLVNIYLLASLPCFLHITLFRNHSWVHDYHNLQFVYALALGFIGFTMLFAWWSGWIGLMLCLHKPHFALVLPRLQLGLVLVGLIFSVRYITYEHGRFPDQFPEFIQEARDVGVWLRQQTDVLDVVFSPDYEIPQEPQQQLAYSNKRVYPLFRPMEIERILSLLPPQAKINIFVFGRPSELVEQPSVTYSPAPDGNPLTKGSMKLWKMDKPSFIKYWHHLQN